MPEMESWQAFAGICSVIIFLGSVAFALRRLGIIGSPAAKDAGSPSAEALALIEATQALLRATEAIAARSEALGRIHSRLDEQRDNIAQVGSEVAHVKGELTAINRTLGIIQEHLLNQK